MSKLSQTKMTPAQQAAATAAFQRGLADEEAEAPSVRRLRVDERYRHFYDAARFQRAKQLEAQRAEAQRKAEIEEAKWRLAGMKMMMPAVRSLVVAEARSGERSRAQAQRDLDRLDMAMATAQGNVVRTQRGEAPFVDTSTLALLDIVAR